MPRTSKLGWIYPTEGQKAWYDIYGALITQQDADTYAAYEDPNLILRGGGNIILNESTDELSWDEDLEILSMLTGGVVTISAGVLSDFEDGKIAYVEVSRPVTGNRTLTLSVGDTIGSNRNNVFVAFRRGGMVYMRSSANQDALAVVDRWDSKKVVTSSVLSGGGTVSGSVPTGVVLGSMWRLRVTALGNTVDSTIQFFSDAGMTNELYIASNKDCYTSPFDDGASWFLGNLTNGLLYYKITNDGLNDSVYDVEFVGIGEMAE
jgi:hypothetical protein